MNEETTSNADASLLEMVSYSGLLSCSSKVGNDERISIWRRLTSINENGFSDLVSSEKSNRGASVGYTWSKAAARFVYAARPAGVGLLITRLRMKVVTVFIQLGFVGMH